MRSGPRISKLSCSSAPRSVSTCGRGRPTSGRPSRAAGRCPPRCAAGGTPGRARGSAGSAAPRSRRRAGRRRSSPAAAARARRSASARLRLLRGVADLDHPDLHLVRRAVGQHRVHLVGDEDQLAPDRDLRPHRVGVLGRTSAGSNRSRRRTAGCPDRRSSCARARPAGASARLTSSSTASNTAPGRQRDALAIARGAGDTSRAAGHATPGDERQSQKNRSAAHPPASPRCTSPDNLAAKIRRRQGRAIRSDGRHCA